MMIHFLISCTVKKIGNLKEKNIKWLKISQTHFQYAITFLLEGLLILKSSNSSCGQKSSKANCSLPRKEVRSMQNQSLMMPKPRNKGPCSWDCFSVSRGSRLGSFHKSRYTHHSKCTMLRNTTITVFPWSFVINQFVQYMAFFTSYSKNVICRRVKSGFNFNQFILNLLAPHIV